MSTVLFWSVVLFAFFGYVRYLERNSVFFPDKEITAVPSDVGLTYDDVYMITPGGEKINGWFVKGMSPTTILYFHGNAGNIGDRLEKLKIFHQLGVSVLLVDYRGYGNSEGFPTEQKIYEDALAAYDYLLTRIDVDKKKIIAYGASLGGAVAVDLALQRELAALIIDSTMTSARDMARRMYPFIPSFVVNIKLDSLEKITKITIPKLIVHSPDDTTIPFEMGKRLFASAPEPKTFVATRGDHNNGHLEAADEFRSAIKAVIEEVQR